MNKDTKIYLGLVAIVILIVAGIFIRNYYLNLPSDEKTMQCIANKSVLIASETCGHCQEQKRILGTYLKDFTVWSVDEDPSLWTKYNLMGVPTWIIGNNSYPGTKSIKELKELANC